MRETCGFFIVPVLIRNSFEIFFYSAMASERKYFFLFLYLENSFEKSHKETDPSYTNLNDYCSHS